MYLEVAAPVVNSVVEGFNGTIFAFGQTGSGKTHTVHGTADWPGIVPRAVQQIFSAIHEGAFEQSLIRVSFLEIYNEVVRDLLVGKNQAKLDVREEPGGAPFVQGLTWLTVKHRSEVSKALEVCSGQCRSSKLACILSVLRAALNLCPHKGNPTAAECRPVTCLA